MGLPSTTAEASTPLVEQEAQGNNSLDVSQRGAVVGEVIPIVFARRVSGVGGVLISPAATESRFQNSVTNEVTGFYHLVLGEGPMDSLQVRDVFQRSCRVGSFSQTYNKRAGTFIPGNFIVPRAGYTTPECPSYCGTGGTYTGLSTLAFQATYPDGITQWNRQVHCFVRGGLYVTRLLDSVLGPSNNVADLLRYLLRSSSRVPDAQVDTASFLAAATFTNVNGFWFNGSISSSTNLREWIGRNLQYFLLRLVRVSGKESLKPLLPTNANGTIKTTAVDWKFAFTEEHIIPDSFEIEYTPLADRKPFAVMVLWRQQDDLGIPLVRTAEVRYTGTAIDGPFEQHDLSAFCASENHAVKVGTYILSRRNHITHRLRIGVRPDAFNPTLAAGDRVRVILERTPSTGAASVHDYLYEVDRIGKSISGEVRLELTHFPIDSSFASVVAKEVNAAVGAGFVLPTGLSGITCDVNSSSDTSIPADTSLDPGDWNIPADGSFDVDVIELDPTDLDDMPSTSIDALAVGGIGGLGGGGGGGGGGSDAAEDNPIDELNDQQDMPVIYNESVVIYFPDVAPPTSTNETVTFEYLDQDASNDYYDTTPFQGVNAFNIIAGEAIVDIEWGFGLSGLNINGPFTVEWFFRLSDNLPSLSEGVGNLYIILTCIDSNASSGFDENGVPTEGGGYDSDGIPVPAGSGPGGFDENGDPLEGGGFDGNGNPVSAAETFVEIVLTTYPELDPEGIPVVPANFFPSLEINIDTVNYSQPEINPYPESNSIFATFAHAVIQHVGNGDYIAYYNGIRISNFTFSEGSPIMVSILSETSNNAGASVSQIRITPSAIYGNVTTFSPPSIPFYVPT